MNHTVIIAEAGVNHNGNKDIALQMIDAAAKAGADYIKFQTFHTKELVTSSCSAADYQKENCSAESQAGMLRRLELSHEDFLFLHDYCKSRNIGFLSTPFDSGSIHFIASLKPDFMKVPSGEITNLPYLRKMAETGIPVIISTGMCSLQEVEDALLPFRERGYDNNDIILLHCTTQYPAPMKDVNLKAMLTLSDKFGVKAGYSDHTRGIEIPIAAVALGACIIEKHFTLSRKMEGPDHAASLEPEELKEMVSAIRNVEMALGSPEKRISPSEESNIKIARRSIVASCPIKKGECFSEFNLTCKRPGSGLSPMFWDKVIGTPSTRDYLPDELIEI